MVATVKEVGSICKAFKNAAPKNKPHLIVANQEGDSRLEPISKNFREALDGGVLKGDKPEIFSLP